MKKLSSKAREKKETYNIRSYTKKEQPKILLLIKESIISKREYVSEKTDIKNLRQSLFAILSLFLVVACGPLFIFGATMFILQGDFLIAGIQILSYIFIVLVICIKRINIDTRQFIIMIMLYFFSVLLLIITGSNGAGLVAILAIMFLSGILLDSKKLFYLVGINLFTFTLLTVFLNIGTLDGTYLHTYKDTWAINMLTTQICCIFRTHLNTLSGALEHFDGNT